MKKIAVITGADSGLGREYTRLILEESNVDEIWALAKTPARLQRLVQDFGARIVPVEIDLMQLDALVDFHRRLSLEKPEIRWLINNAGIGKFGPFEKLESLESARIGLSTIMRILKGRRWYLIPLPKPSAMSGPAGRYQPVGATRSTQITTAERKNKYGVMCFMIQERPPHMGDLSCMIFVLFTLISLAS
mgnify:CR=1 FL=1